MTSSVEGARPTRKRTAVYIHTGRPCKQGHVGPRYKNGNCVECLLDREREKYRDPRLAEEKRAREAARYWSDPVAYNLRSLRYRAENSHEIRKRRGEKYAANPEPVRSAAAAWRSANREKVAESGRKYRAANADLVRSRNQARRAMSGEAFKLRAREYSRKHYRENKHLYAEKRARRRLQEVRATPTWADQRKVKSLYLAARAGGLTVDHVVPLTGKVSGVHLVCGLHWEGNMQLMPSAENKSKNCRTWPNMPN